MLSDRDRDAICDQYIDAMIWANCPKDIDGIMDVACRDSDIGPYHFARLVAISKSFKTRLELKLAEYV